MEKNIKQASVPTPSPTTRQKIKQKLMGEEFFVSVPTVPTAVADDDEPIKKKKIPSPFTQQLPPERKWATAPIFEKSPSLLAWLTDCQAIVDLHFGKDINQLIAKVITNYIWITMQSKTEIRSFAFIEKKTGNIHCPALFDEPFSDPHGNIVDDVTRTAIISPWGVRTPWSWLPTFPEGTRFVRKRK